MGFRDKTANTVHLHVSDFPEIWLVGGFMSKRNLYPFQLCMKNGDSHVPFMGFTPQIVFKWTVVHMKTSEMPSVYFSLNVLCRCEHFSVIFREIISP